MALTELPPGHVLSLVRSGGSVTLTPFVIDSFRCSLQSTRFSSHFPVEEWNKPSFGAPREQQLKKESTCHIYIVMPNAA